MKRYLTEFIGTFFLVLTVGLTVVGGSPMAPLAIGCSLMIMVYMGGHISGGHYNPAVSFGLALRRKMAWVDFAPYVVSQVLGSLAAAWVVLATTGHTFAPEPASTASAMQALLIEVLFTFALVLVVLNSATHAATKGNSFYGLAIGFTIVVAAFAGGPISGGAFNPAVGIGSTVFHATMGAGTWAHLWLYLVGPLAGGALAAGVFAVQEGA
jgi:aquaporin Z